MIATIGVMVGMYIITKCAYIGSHKDAGLTSRILSGLTILITIWCLLGLLLDATKSL